MSGRHFKSVDSAVGFCFIPGWGYVGNRSYLNRVVGNHHKYLIELNFIRGQVQQYMYFDDGEKCPNVGCQHGWRKNGRGVAV